jgi:putative sugar O-methyltransferase
MLKNLKLSEEFIKNSKDFFKDNDLDLDIKHHEIVKSFYKEFKKDKNFFINKFRDWSGQSDYNTPPQLSLENLKKNGFYSGLFFELIKYVYSYMKPEAYEGFYDDLKILKNFGYDKYIEQNAVHLTPNCKNFYFINKKVSTNVRWNRYAFITGQIEKYKLLNSQSTWVDIGSYYGGLQSFIKKLYPNINIIMVDFNHQLCRSYIFLKQIFPDTNHIFPDELDKIQNIENYKNSIFYVPVKKYFDLSIETDLLTNFFSFGEMKNKEFYKYHDSDIYKKSKYKYLINRNVGSPIFEKTYDTDITILDYKLNDKQIIYFNMHPIQHFQLQKRFLYGKKKFRARSSDHFEVIFK